MALFPRVGGEKIRFFLLRTHYRSTVEFGEAAINEAGGALDKFYVFFERYERIAGRSFYLQPDNEEEDRKLIRHRTEGEINGSHELMQQTKEHRARFLAAMDDDFNSGAAISELFQLLSVLNRFVDEKKLENAKGRSDADFGAFLRSVETLRELAAILGLFVKPVASTSGGGQEAELLDGVMQLVIQLRNDARKEKNFAIADKIRDSLTDLKIALEDRADGTGWKPE